MAQSSSIKRYFLGIAVYFLVLKLAQSQKSPCPNIFTYTIYPGTDQVVGFLKIRNIQVGQVAQINLLMAIQAKLPTVSFVVVNAIYHRNITPRLNFDQLSVRLDYVRKKIPVLNLLEKSNRNIFNRDDRN